MVGKANVSQQDIMNFLDDSYKKNIKWRSYD